MNRRRSEGGGGTSLLVVVFITRTRYDAGVGKWKIRTSLAAAAGDGNPGEFAGRRHLADMNQEPVG